MDTASAVGASGDLLTSLRVIDSDSHFTEPADLWTSRAPAKLRDRVPRVVEKGDAIGSWVVDDVEFGPAIGWSAILPDGGKVPVHHVSGLGHKDVHPASFDPEARIRMLDELGIYAQVMYPNVAGFGSQRFGEVGDEVLRRACVEIYNDYMAEVQERSDNRLLPMALVPWWDPQGCVREVQRAAKLGLRGVNMASDPQDRAGVPDLGDAAWAPFWDACCAEGLPVNFHIGSSKSVDEWRWASAWPSLSQEMRFLLGGVTIFMGNAKVVNNLVVSGVLERHPDLKVVSVESGVGWLCYLAEALDYQHAEQRRDIGASLPRDPSEYIRRNIYACFWFETLEGYDISRYIDEDHIMFETDFPHPTCLYPDPLGRVIPALASRGPEFSRKVLQDNAAALYRISLPE